MRNEFSLGSHLPSSTEMANFDSRAINGGIKSVDLMERAGVGVYSVLYREIKERGFISEDVPSVIAVLCGPGNNGGDGLVVGRLLVEAGFSVIVVVAAASSYSPELTYQLAKFNSVSRECIFVYGGELVTDVCNIKTITQDQLSALLSNCVCVVDALLGLGQSGAPRGNIELIVSTLKESKNVPFVLSIDIPTGVNCDTGEVYNPSIQADTTVAIQAIKRGVAMFPARNVTGNVEIIDIGIEILPIPEFSIIGVEELRDFLSREDTAHKGNFGRVIIVAGSEEMPGAAVLASLGAIRGGAGSVLLCQYEDLNYGSIPIEIMRLKLKGGTQLIKQMCSQILDISTLEDSILLGPGLGLNQATIEAVNNLFEAGVGVKYKCIVDADALTILSELNLQLPNAILTPHPGEAARLLKCSVGDVQRDRFAAAKELHNKYKSVVILKGAGTIVYSGASGVVVPFGNPWMATPGSGDILAGLVAALNGQLKTGFKSAALGALLHGLAGDIAAKNGVPLIASDIAESVRSAVLGLVDV